MFWPKPTSAGEAPRKRAAAPWAVATTASARRLDSKGPPRLAFASRRHSAIASITDSLGVGGEQLNAELRKDADAKTGNPIGTNLSTTFNTVATNI